MKTKPLLSVISISIFGLIIFSFLSITGCNPLSKDFDLSVDKDNKQDFQDTTHSLPKGYTLESYTVDKVTEEVCKKDSDCKNPMDYLVQSRCPFTSICLENRCAVVCPDIKTIEVQGKIIAIKKEIDGSILTIKDDNKTYDVLVSIPNLGQEFTSQIKDIKVGKYIQVIGNPIYIIDSERIIASQISVKDTFTDEYRCNLKPDAGNCKAAMPRYYFDNIQGICKQFLWGGCDGTVPFDSLDACKNTCESPKI